MASTLFFPNGSLNGIYVSSRDEILEILRMKVEAIVEIDIVPNDGEILVLARMRDDVSWIGVGLVNNLI